MLATGNRPERKEETMTKTMYQRMPESGMKGLLPIEAFANVAVQVPGVTDTELKEEMRDLFRGSEVWDNGEMLCYLYWFYEEKQAMNYRKGYEIFLTVAKERIEKLGCSLEKDPARL